MASLFGLDQLARFAPQIFGRALSMDGVMGVLCATSGRHDHIDSHTYEMRAALEALSLLYRLSSSQRIFAQVLLYTHVICGEEARKQPDTWVSVAYLVASQKRPSKGPLSIEKRATYLKTGLALYGAAKAYWGRL